MSKIEIRGMEAVVSKRRIYVISVNNTKGAGMAATIKKETRIYP